jgi:hypothetical protein
MTPARKEHAAGAACNSVAIASRSRPTLVANA